MTTEERKPLKVPDSVHIKITPEGLKDYVGPPVYYKDRMYGFSPPPGISTGLGYLGNGSGAVMPIEAAVSECCLLCLQITLMCCYHRVCQEKATLSLPENWVKSFVRVHKLV